MKQERIKMYECDICCDLTDTRYLYIHNKERFCVRCLKDNDIIDEYDFKYLKNEQEQNNYENANYYGENKRRKKGT